MRSALLTAVAGLFASIVAMSSAEAQKALHTETADKGASRPTVASPSSQHVPPTFKLPDPPIPVRQAQEIGLGQCASVLETMSKDALTSPYDVQSGWSRGDPTHHVFQAVAALRNPTNNPPDGLAALIAAPLGAGGCDGVIVQIFPLAGDCQSAQKVMMRTGRLLGPMSGTRIMLDARGNRVILLPAFANTCIAISVDTRFGDLATPAPR